MPWWSARQGPQLPHPAPADPLEVLQHCDSVVPSQAPETKLQADHAMPITTRYTDQPVLRSRDAWLFTGTPAAALGLVQVVISMSRPSYVVPSVYYADPALRLCKNFDPLFRLSRRGFDAVLPGARSSFCFTICARVRFQPTWMPSQANLPPPPRRRP